MFIRKKPPRAHAPGEPLLHENHPRPVTRRDFMAAGLMSGPAMVIGPAWLAALLKARRAGAALSPDIQALLTANQCNVPTAGGGIPFICFDLAGGANLVGSEVLVGQQGGQTSFLSTAGYELLGVPGNMVPTSSANIDRSLGLLWHADGAIKRGIMSVAAASTAAGTSGAVFCAMSQNDTQNNPHNPMYGIAMAGAKGQLMTLCGTQSTVSGGDSAAPMALINPALQPTTIAQPSDATALVPIPPGGHQDPLAVATLESQARISAGTTPQSGSGDVAAFTGALGAPSGANAGVSLYPASDPTDDAALKNQVRCAYVKAANTADVFGNPSALDPTQDPNIVGGAKPAIFPLSAFADAETAATATVMKLVVNGFAGAGTITLGGYDYHDGSRATGETKNFHAGQMIGGVLEYAARLGKPVMIYVISDGSLNSNGMVDSSAAGRDKLGWQGDNSSVASTFFLVYSPKGRPPLMNGAAGQQIGYFTSGGNVVSSSSIVGNAVSTLVQVVILNYMGLLGTTNQYAALFPAMGLGSAAQMDALTAFQPIV
ncbi:MAG: general secretion pathway protein GspF [Gammaproteobacteria bacterium]|nr:general secretion pathway protein GspF [Gammaproteobacteria bacterium]